MNQIPVADPANQQLANALVEIERYLSHGGWDQPARLFALAPTRDLVAAEPSLAEQLNLANEDGLSSIEQDDFQAGEDLLVELSKIKWSDAVVGAAIGVERCFLPAQVEAEIPDDPQSAADFVANHEAREDIRVVIGVLRTGQRFGVARILSQPEELLSGSGLVPVLEQALSETLK